MPLQRATLHATTVAGELLSGPAVYKLNWKAYSSLQNTSCAKTQQIFYLLTKTFYRNFPGKVVSLTTHWNVSCKGTSFRHRLLHSQIPDSCEVSQTSQCDAVTVETNSGNDATDRLMKQRRTTSLQPVMWSTRNPRTLQFRM